MNYPRPSHLTSLFSHFFVFPLFFLLLVICPYGNQVFADLTDEDRNFMLGLLEQRFTPDKVSDMKELLKRAQQLQTDFASDPVMSTALGKNFNLQVERMKSYIKVAEIFSLCVEENTDNKYLLDSLLEVPGKFRC